MPRTITLINSYLLFRNIFLFIFLLCMGMQMVKANELHLVLNGKSIHVEKQPGETLNERNLGIGFQYEFNHMSKQWVPFLNLGGFADSYDKPSYYVGGGIVRRYKLRNNLLNLQLDAGLTGFVMTKADINENEPFPGILPVVSVGNKHAALNITYIPKLSETGTDLWFMQIKIRLSH